MLPYRVSLGGPSVSSYEFNRPETKTTPRCATQPFWVALVRSGEHVQAARSKVHFPSLVQLLSSRFTCAVGSTIQRIVSDSSPDLIRRGCLPDRIQQDIRIYAVNEDNLPTGKSGVSIKNL